jgi:predicted DsbA family dithiol-disulfide isomerase
VSEVLESDRFADQVRADEAEAQELGCTGVPFFVFDRAFAVPGAQEVDVFLLTLQRAWARKKQVGPQSVVAAGAACEGDACEI